jgi:phosphoenolpyruvate---glycerone phosphotransferase subunit DhaL
MPKSNLSSAEVKAMLILACERIIAAEPMLSEADRNLGDGDHGLGMERGMTAAKEKLESTEFDSIDKVFSAVGMAMMSAMGGASGAIFGTYFRNGGKAIAGQTELTSTGLAAFFEAGVEGVKQRGGAKVGDKTTVDAMQPAADKAKEVTNLPLAQAITEIHNASLAGLEASKAMIAQFGRAKTLGEACLGFPDAGALSVTVIIGAMKDYITA